MHSYSNPSSRCAGPECGCDDAPRGCRCCDRIDPRGSCVGAQRCDNRFTYCLQRAASLSAGGGAACSQNDGGARTSIVNWNDQSIDFTADEVLGLSNSFNLLGLETLWMVRMVSS